MLHGWVNLQVLREVYKGVPIGKILIQRDETSVDKRPRLFYSKLPAGIERSRVLLLDPMLASGGSAICAVRHLTERGVPEQQITFVNLIACPEGLKAFFAACPLVRVVTSMIDYGMFLFSANWFFVHLLHFVFVFWSAQVAVFDSCFVVHASFRVCFIFVCSWFVHHHHLS